MYIVSSAISILDSKKGEILQECKGLDTPIKLHMKSGRFHSVSRLEIYNQIGRCLKNAKPETWMNLLQELYSTTIGADEVARGDITPTLHKYTGKHQKTNSCHLARSTRHKHHQKSVG